MSPPTFMTLPVEIRQSIYRYAISEEAEFDFESENLVSLSKHLKQSYNERPSLLLTNRQINTEVSGINPTIVSARACCLGCFDDYVSDVDRRLIRRVKIVCRQSEDIAVFTNFIGAVLPDDWDEAGGGCLEKFKVLSVHSMQARGAEAVFEIVEYAD